MAYITAQSNFLSTKDSFLNKTGRMKMSQQMPEESDENLSNS
jgi:hypothetical protein